VKAKADISLLELERTSLPGRQSLCDWWRLVRTAAALQNRGLSSAAAVFVSSCDSYIRLSALIPPVFGAFFRERACDPGGERCLISYRVSDWREERRAPLGWPKPGGPLASGADGVCGSLAAGHPFHSDTRGEPLRGSRRSPACPWSLDPPPEGRMPQPASAREGVFCQDHLRADRT
jgi:hypothetical protein